MSGPATDELASVLLKRYECLNALVNQPQAKPELVDTLNMPRSTLDDVVRELEQADPVEYGDGDWYLTQSGRLACCAHRDYLNRLNSLRDVSSMLDSVGTGEEVSWAFIDGADTYENHSNVQNAVMTKLLDFAEVATEIRVVTPNIVAGYADKFYQSGISGQDTTFEMIIPPEIHSWFQSTHPSVAKNILDDPDMNILQASIQFSFGLSIFDHNHAGITIFTEHGIAGLLVNDTDDALAWAEEQYKRVKQDAEPLFLRGASTTTN
ncbi:winged helix-turn-helix domain-containing protein [Halorubrum sp. Atlit-28R]|uniref:helix-turn-helix transcriptional regulator n=1 Tax=Halorubrum sp. Atlit-28R TaxID=2282129 RepID=UPI000EF1B7FC|nr:hypothetical protein [Halorubrum sp. Atlit-28R]RLM49639.1 hypothetical protein DVK06_13885 [Halorubrum sp. Atlit-28R]